MSQLSYKGNYSVELIQESATEERIKKISGAILNNNILNIIDWEVHQTIWGIQHIDNTGLYFWFNYQEMISIRDNTGKTLRENFSAEKMRNPDKVK